MFPYILSFLMQASLYIRYFKYHVGTCIPIDLEKAIPTIPSLDQ